MRRFVFVLALGAVSVFSQQNRPSFDAVAIKPSQVAPFRSDLLKGIHIDNFQVSISSVSLLTLLSMAFRVPEFQIDAPSWAANTGVELRATIPEKGSIEQLPQMLQSLLADRLGLVFHKEDRTRAVYSLVVAKSGASLAAVKTSPDSQSSDTIAPGSVTWSPLGEIQMTVDNSGPRMTGKGFRLAMSGDQMMFEASTLTSLVAFLSADCDRPVVDNTGLEGNYNVSLPLPNGNVRRPGDPAATIVDSYREALGKMGLQLVAGKAATDTLVVDHLNQKPTEN